jgi:hypothetical protein
MRMDSDENPQAVARTFGSDETVRWSCHAGEYVLWVGTDSFFSADRESAWKIRDFWQIRDGDFVSITNRWADLPAWFELHPLEVANRALWEMKKRLDAGYKPADPVYGANIWRMKAGDRLVWVSLQHPAKPVREILDFQDCALAVGENSIPKFDEPILFGAPEGTDLPPPAAAAMRAGFKAAVALGMPNTYAQEWRFGA